MSDLTIGEMMQAYFDSIPERSAVDMVREMNEKSRDDRNCISYWLPKIAEAGLPTPRTVLIEMPEAAQVEAWGMFDNPNMQSGKAWIDFVDAAKAASDVIGYPLFLRSGHTSGKHDWSRTCHVTDREKLGDHIFSIIYFSECCGMFGELPWRQWALREYLPIKPFGIAPEYSDMPVCREFRFFATDGRVDCWHPYWPREALERGGCVLSEDGISEMWRLDEVSLLTEMAERASRACGGSWSIDFLETERGWFLTDMAEAARSYHWEGCASTNTPGEAK